jgi:hypothetical protein
MKCKTALFYTCILFVISACTITKRHYNRGYNVEWRAHYAAHHDQNDSIEKDRSTASDGSKFKPAEEQLQEQPIEVTPESQSQIEVKNTDCSTRQLTRIHAIQKGEKHFQRNKRIPFIKKNTLFKQTKSSPEFIGEGIRTPREYLIAALACLIGGIVLVGIAVLFIIVVEVEGLSIGGLLVYLMVIVGFGCLVAVPICLLLALFSYLFFM